MAICMVGWSHSRFGRLDEDVEALVVQVTRDALADAGVGPEAIDAIYLGSFNAGMWPESFLASMPLQADPALRFTPCVRVENACASGSAAIYEGMRRIAAGEARLVLVVGVEKMTGVSTAEATRALASASHLREEGAMGVTAPGMFGALASAYFERYGNVSDSLARIAVKNHANALRNPLAQLRKPFDFAFCSTVSEKNPLIAGPLRLTDCSPISDGAAALVLADAETARSMRKAVAFRAARHVSDYLPMSRRDFVAFEGPTLAWQQAYQQAGIKVNDLSFAEVHDCFTIAELKIYEAMGLCECGQGARAIDEGWTTAEGRLPVNPSGGLKAKGHPIGATGVSLHVMAAKQLLHEAGEIQLRDPRLGGVFNMGGSAVASYVSILEPLKG